MASQTRRNMPSGCNTRLLPAKTDSRVPSPDLGPLATGESAPPYIKTEAFDRKSPVTITGAITFTSETQPRPHLKTKRSLQAVAHSRPETGVGGSTETGFKRKIGRPVCGAILSGPGPWSVADAVHRHDLHNCFHKNSLKRYLGPLHQRGGRQQTLPRTYLGTFRGELLP